jgi:hypothetical protein
LFGIIPIIPNVRPRPDSFTVSRPPG